MPNPKGINQYTGKSGGKKAGPPKMSGYNAGAAARKSAVAANEKAVKAAKANPGRKYASDAYAKKRKAAGL